MKIYIDADGCPVVDETVEIAFKYGIKCIILCDTAHRIERKNAETIIVEKGADSVDFKLVNLISNGDIAITQDYGLAAMCLGRNAYAINQDGKIYSDENISGLLEFRAISKKIRKSVGHTKSMPKRKSIQDENFKKSLAKLIEKLETEKTNE